MFTIAQNNLRWSISFVRVFSYFLFDCIVVFRFFRFLVICFNAHSNRMMHTHLWLFTFQIAWMIECGVRFSTSFLNSSNCIFVLAIFQMLSQINAKVKNTINNHIGWLAQYIITFNGWRNVQWLYVKLWHVTKHLSNKETIYDINISKTYTFSSETTSEKREIERMFFFFRIVNMNKPTDDVSNQQKNM